MLFCVNISLRLEKNELRNAHVSAKISAILTFSLLFPPLPERRARPGSRDVLQLWAEARLGPRKDGCCSGVDGARERALGFAPPRPHRTLTMRPVSRRTLDWIYSVVGNPGVGTPQCHIPRPASRRPTVCLQFGTPKPIPNLSVYAQLSAPPLPGGHALPPLTSGLPGLLALRLPLSDSDNLLPPVASNLA